MHETIVQNWQTLNVGYSPITAGMMAMNSKCSMAVYYKGREEIDMEIP